MTADSNVFTFGVNKGGFEIKLKSSTGGNLIVYESGIDDKILATLELPDNDEWTTIEVDSKDTDAKESNIFLEFNTKKGSSEFDLSMEWFKFNRRIDAFDKIMGISADERHGVDISGGGFLNHIENGDWVRFDDIDFGKGDVNNVALNVATGLAGGTAEFYIDSLDGEPIAELEIKNTGDWNTFLTYDTAVDADVKGVHDLYIKFVSTLDTSICDLMWLEFSKDIISVDYEVVGEIANVFISDNTALPEDEVTVRIFGIPSDYEVTSVIITDSQGNEITKQKDDSEELYKFTLPENIPVLVTVEVDETTLEINPNDKFNLEESTKGDTNSKDGQGGGSIRIDTEHFGYTGSGYVAGWQAVGHYIEFNDNIKETGTYDLVLRGAAGPKNEDKYDDSPRTGALYIDDSKHSDFSLEIQDDWKTWIEYTFEDVFLESGKHSFKIRSEGDVNPGNFNLDSLKFSTKRTLESIAITNNPDKTEYYPGEELDLAGLEVIAIYSDGQETVISDADYDVSGYDKNQIGEQTISLKYEGKKTSFNVKVIERDSEQLKTVTFESGANGSLTGDLIISDILAGTDWEAITVPTPVADDGYKFKGWTPEFPETVDESVTYTANFERVESKIPKEPEDEVKEDKPETPGTGIGTNVALYTSALIASLGGLYILRRKKRK